MCVYVCVCVCVYVCAVNCREGQCESQGQVGSEGTAVLGTTHSTEPIVSAFYYIDHSHNLYTHNSNVYCVFTLH